MTHFNYQSKRIFYKEVGVGKPLIMLHGDTASSVMFEFFDYFTPRDPGLSFAQTH